MIFGLNVQMSKSNRYHLLTSCIYSDIYHIKRFSSSGFYCYITRIKQ